MRRLLPLTTAALLIPLAACGSGDSSGSSPSAADDCTPGIEGGDLVEDGTLTMSTNATLPPMQYVESGDEIVGMRVDLGKELAARLCLEPEFVNVPFDAQIPGVQSGRWDMINTGMFYTPERAETVTLVPYEIQGVSVSVPAGNPDGITSEDDLSGKTIAVEAPGYEYDTLEALNAGFQEAGRPEINLQTFHNNADAYQALSAGQVDGVAIVESVTTYYQGNGRFETAVSGMNTAPLALGFSDTTVAEAVAGALRELDEEGYLAELFEEYNVMPYSGPIEVTTGPVSVE
ncbi:ABC transporter substrate-binding protein [Streptomyces sp. NBC_01803]|uniref:ABC transporter substrate-binding protein n=1 Tax=Streptomyces sp. NBC_01803 TaxID=2975946 RepID=UPI002DD8E6B7|nr:ABC transporter substrate-binding protein [Streptomyces sp. NBC_01803]WSA43299.1 ABC transporter substrate-binding protein [Streptomyces sp. NBC_01803]